MTDTAEVEHPPECGCADAACQPFQREACLRWMRAASGGFYYMAVKAGNHAFIEFTGLMNEYIEACQRAADSGVDFRFASKHSGKGSQLPVPEHACKYIREKLDCIYGLDVLREEL